MGNDFQQTELGPLPKDWDLAKLGDIFSIQQGKALSQKNQTGKSPKPFLRTANVLWGYLDLSTIDQMDFTEEEVEKLHLKPNDLLVCEGGDIGRTAIWRGEIHNCLCQNHIHRLRLILLDAEPLFFMYWMQAAINILGLYEGEGNKTTIPNLSKARLSKFLVPLPPLPEQQRIASVLSAVQEARDKTKSVIEAAREMKKSLMKHIFTYGPVPLTDAEKVQLKENAIGPMPDHWQLVRIGDLFHVQLGKMLSPKAHIGESPIPYLRNSNVQWGWIDISDIKKMDFSEKEANKFSLRYGDILICEGGDVGRTAIWRDEIKGCSYQKALHRLRPKNNQMIPEFFMYYFMIAFTIRNTYGVSGTQTTIPHLPAMKLKALEIPLTSLNEQKCIVDILSAIENKINAEENKRDALNALFKTLLNKLMTGKIRVNHQEMVQ